MKSIKYLWLAASALLTACQAEQNIENPAGEMPLPGEGIVAITESISLPGTRVAVNPKDATNTHFSFPWQAGDKIALFANTHDIDALAFLTLKSETAGNTKGTFTGAYSVKEGVDYYTFYPANNLTGATDITAVPVDFTGQSHEDSDSPTAAMGKYVYFASKQAADGSFKNKHIGTLLKLSVPDNYNTDCTGVELSTDVTAFVLKGTINLTTATESAAPAITPTATSNSMTIGYSSTNNSKKWVDIHAMMAPTDLTGHSLTVTTKHTDSSHDRSYVMDGGVIGRGTLLNFAPVTVNFIDASEINEVINNLEDRDKVTEIHFEASQTKPAGDTDNHDCWYTLTPDGTSLTFYTTEESFDNERMPLELHFNNFINLKSLDLSNVLLKIKDSNVKPMFPYSIKSITFSEVVSGGSLSYLFAGCSFLESIDLSGFNTYKVTDMAEMFSGCSSLQSITFGDNFDTSSVENMIAMFKGCSSLQSITFGENFSTQNVTEMNSMFNGCSSLQSLDLSSFNTSSATNIAGMFWNCKKLASLTLGNWDVSQIDFRKDYMFTNTGSELTSGKCVVKGVTDATLKTWLMTGTGWDSEHIEFEPAKGDVTINEDTFKREENW
ncbi:MAG: BspA family leucine-rich repeat surface protein [Bacteroidales bacterium]|nr:BspA family leucine-rich repeat surface protein [Candidatus Minthousia equi]